MNHLCAFVLRLASASAHLSSARVFPANPGLGFDRQRGGYNLERAADALDEGL